MCKLFVVQTRDTSSITQVLKPFNTLHIIYFSFAITPHAIIHRDAIV
jgi:hypothetical protein